MLERSENLDKVIWREVLSLKSYFTQYGLTLSVAESCTGGEVASFITQVPGASRFFRGGIVVYSPFYKEYIVGVDGDIIKRNGTVSPEVAISLSKHIKDISHASVGAAVVCVLGPRKDEKDNLVGTTFVAITYNRTYVYNEIVFPRSRRLMKKIVALKVLRLIRSVVRDETICGG